MPISACKPATTIWLFRELIEKLFDRFDQHLAAKGYMARGGQIIDASIVPVPTQRTVVTRTPSCRLGAHQRDGREARHYPSDGPVAASHRIGK